jgi:hypothetical protein
VDAFAMLVQLQREMRNDVRLVRTRDLPDLAQRVTRLEAQIAASSPSSGPRTWSLPAKAGAGVAGVGAIVPVFYALIQLAQSVGWIPAPPPAPSAPPAITAPAQP